MIDSPLLHTIPIDELMDLAIYGYKNDTNSPLEQLDRIPFWTKLLNERKLKKLINELFDELEPYVPEIQSQVDDPSELSASTQQEVKGLIVKAMREIDEKQLLFDQPFLTYFVDKGYMDAAERFLYRAKKEDPELNNQEIFQALRNVWIMNSLQLYWDMPLELTTPMYAYSMLYPYTDNLLDDPAAPADTKWAFNNRLAEVLAGETLKSEQAVEKRVFSLVEQIQTHFPKDTYPQVTESIQLIHKAQVESMLQGRAESLTEEDILNISFFKGGTSVLADAYLIKGSLSKEELTFAFQYGAFLQLLDDLQDKQEDESTHNQTLFSTKQTQETIDKEIRRLISYIFSVNVENNSDSYNTSLMKNVISQCTLLMVMEAVGKSPEIVSHSLYKELASHSKVRLTFYKELETKMKEFLKQ